MPIDRKINFQSLAWFWDLYQRKIIDLNPPYQRRSVWNQEYKDFFIDTVLLGYPAPAIFLYEEISADGRSRYAVVDGKQRLTTLFDFASNVFPSSEQNSISSLRGKYFQDFDDDTKRNFWKYPFAVEYLPTPDEKIINSIFDRINRNVSKLSAQELRHARFSGSFISTAEELSEEMAALLPKGFPQIAQKSKSQMKDVELTAQLLLLIEEGVRSYSQDDLDVAFSDRDIEWPQMAEIKARLRSAITQVGLIVQKPSNSGIELTKSRLRNQADFYSLIGAIDRKMSAGGAIDTDASRENLAQFLTVIESEELRETDGFAKNYYEAARSASNDATPRSVRIDILSSKLA
jgi:hypothetical protein